MRAPMDTRMQARLGEQLKLLFAETAVEPIPTRFMQLLDRLEINATEVEMAAWKSSPPLSNEVRA